MTETLALPKGPYPVLHMPSSGPTVVLLHGASGHGQTWSLVKDAWSWADVYAPSLPGRPDGAPIDSIPALAAWLASVVEALPSDNVFVVGHSLGGGVALQLALDPPSGLAGIAMVASSARLRVSTAILDAVEASSPEGPFRLDFAFKDPAVAERYAGCATAPRAASRADWTACDGFDVRERLHAIDLPVLVVHGDADPLTPAKHQQSLVDAVPNGQRVCIDGGGHMIPWEQPTEVANTVREWIAS